jgi:hypothetical protein
MRNKRADAIRLLSPLKSEQVLNNLKQRGREWRESVLPPDLRNAGVKNLSVETKGDGFTLQWVGGASVLYNPAFIGSVIDVAGGGSEISGHIGRKIPQPLAIVVLVALPFQAFLTSSVLLGWTSAAVILWTLFHLLWTKRRGTEALEPNLLRVIEEAARC